MAGNDMHTPLRIKDHASREYEEQEHKLLEACRQTELQNKASDWKAPAIILAFECLESMAFNGIATNLVVYFRTVRHDSVASSASSVSIWYGTSFLAPILGALMADTWWGNYKTIFISLIMYFIGMVLFTGSAFMQHSSTSALRDVAFFLGLYLVAIGTGGVRSALLPFGADQFDDEDSVDRQKKRFFFSWFYLCVIFGVLASGTIIVWIQENVNWALGYGITTMCIALAFAGFVWGTPMYRLRLPSGTPVKSICQVLVASFRKMRLEAPKDSSLLYEDKGSYHGQGKIAHSDEFSFLDKAAIISEPDLENNGQESSWWICTVTQVEELKILLRSFPIWTTGVVYAISMSQVYTTFIQQGMEMDSKIGSLSIPSASLYSIEVVFVTCWVLLFNKVITPLATRYSNGAELSQLQRIGIGHLFMICAMAIAASTEMRRLQGIRNGNLMSIAWQLPQYFVIAGSECFTYITQFEFFHGQAPESMKSMLTALALLTVSLGNYLSSLIITLVVAVTRVGGQPGWITDDMNQGHLDYYFWSLTALSSLNFVAYLYFARKYKLKEVIQEFGSGCN